MDEIKSDYLMPCPYNWTFGDTLKIDLHFALECIAEANYKEAEIRLSKNNSENLNKNIPYERLTFETVKVNLPYGDLWEGWE